ncbi:DUF2795 domain-containing protein [Nonomuraea sp. NPDC050451]|uniref:DUF2795 domain-containing protein n=1 Tax=Nonomuraea sp. NPDC050451 TaxID=3364364 RepID=UPI0037B61F5A
MSWIPGDGGSAPEGVLSALRSLPDRTFDNVEDSAHELGIGGDQQRDGPGRRRARRSTSAGGSLAHRRGN